MISLTRFRREVVSNDPEEELASYQYRGARALVLQHERELRRFVETWKDALGAGLILRGFDSPNYKSLETLLTHVLWWARDYMVWACDKLGLPDPEIADVPTPDAIETELDSYLEHLLSRWRVQLCEISEGAFFFSPQHTTRWGARLPVETVLEHAVVHPMRLRLQLLDLLQQVDRLE